MSEGKAMLHWSRVGDQAQVGPLDVSGSFDIDALRAAIQAQVDSHLSGQFKVKIKVEVSLGGGPWLNLPYGYGEIRGADE